MEDLALNRSLGESFELQTRWNQFREFVRMATERGNVTPEAEMKFLELKSIIAMLHDGFMEKLQHDQKTGQNIMSIVGDCILLSRITDYNDAEKQKFEFDWNECYLLINEQVQALRDEKEKLAGISARAFRASKRRERFRAKLYKFFHSEGLKWTLILIGVGAGLFIVPKFIYSYRNFKDIPGLDKVYYQVSNKFYRPFLNREYAYDRWQDVGIKNGNPPNLVSLDDSSQMTQAFFNQSVLNSLGFSQQAADAARTFFNTHVINYLADRLNANGADVQCYYLLFDTTDNAKQYADQIRQAVGQLAANQSQQVRNRSYLVRKANIVAIGISSNPNRAGWIQQRLPQVNDGEPSLLDQ